MKLIAARAFMAVGTILLLSTGGEVIGAPKEKPPNSNGIQGVNDRLDEILERLESVEEMLDEPPPTATATFCVSQGHGIELGGDLAAELKAQVDAGIGWAEIGSVKLVASPSWPLVLPIVLPPVPPLPPVVLGAVPIPTEVKVGLKGGIGRLTDLCIDIPVKLSPDDQEQLRQLAKDINESPLGFQKSKFQRRASRLVNYASRKVPGIQADPDVEAAFDRADEAFRSLMDDGLKESGEGLGVFRDSNIGDLLATLDMPVNVASLMNDPEQIFNALPDLGNGFDGLTCEDLGVSQPIRARPRMDNLCQELDELPSFEKLRDGLAGVPEEIVDAVAENLVFVLEDAEEKRNQKKSDFCASTAGRRPVFDRFCGR